MPYIYLLEKLARLKPVVVSGLKDLMSQLVVIKDRVVATDDLSLAVALTAPLAGAREDFHLLAKLSERYREREIFVVNQSEQC